jgi:hypothetical protein
LVRRLERSSEWDPMIVQAQLVSEKKRCQGAVSTIMLDLAGKRIESKAVITLFKPNNALSWVLTDKPKVKEYWKLQSNKDGTMIHFSLGYELNGFLVNRILKKSIWERKLKKETQRILEHLKVTAEKIV